jgi:hypothetical protein
MQFQKNARCFTWIASKSKANLFTFFNRKAHQKFAIYGLQKNALLLKDGGD